jgi:hypothetical protein
LNVEHLQMGLDQEQGRRVGPNHSRVAASRIRRLTRNRPAARGHSPKRRKRSRTEQ